MTDQNQLIELINLTVDEQVKQSEYVESPTVLDNDAHIAIRADGRGRGYLVINGIDMSNVTRSFSFKWDANGIPVVCVEFVTRQLDIIADSAQIKELERLGKG